MMHRSGRERAGFSIDNVSPLYVVPGSFIPALFGEPLLQRLNPSQALCLLGLREPVNQPSLLGASTQRCLLTSGAIVTLRACCQRVAVLGHFFFASPNTMTQGICQTSS